jgi:hypothetical protein
VQRSAVGVAQRPQAADQLPDRRDGKPGPGQILDGEVVGEDSRETKSFAGALPLREPSRMTFQPLHHLLIEDRRRAIETRTNRRPRRFAR